jgi:hypothetical protein
MHRVRVKKDGIALKRKLKVHNPGQNPDMREFIYLDQLEICKHCGHYNGTIEECEEYALIKCANFWDYHRFAGEMLIDMPDLGCCGWWSCYCYQKQYTDCFSQ